MKKIFIFIAFVFASLTAFAQNEGIEGQDAPSDFYWQSPKKDELAFRLLAADGESKTLYIRKSDFFAPVIANTSRSISTIYPSPSKSGIEFYLRETKDGKVLFKPAFSVKAEGAKDLIIFLKGNASSGFAYEKLDTSFDKFPLGTMSVINLLPQKIGVMLEKSKAVLGKYESKSLSFSGEPAIKDIPIKLFSLKDGSQLRYSRNLSFCTDERMIVFIFALPNPEKNDSGKIPPMVFMYGTKR